MILGLVGGGGAVLIAGVFHVRWCAANFVHVHYVKTEGNNWRILILQDASGLSSNIWLSG